MRRRPWAAIAATLFLVLLVAGIAVATWLNPPKRFTIPRVAIEASLAGDGSMQVVEHLTYDFTGSFTYGTRPIPGGTYQIENVTVSEGGHPLRSVGAPYNLQWFFDATDEQRTFDISYTVRNAVLPGSDVFELYWKWVGEDHPKIGRVNVRLLTPPGGGELRAWGHGPLNGIVRVGVDRVRWDARSVPTGTFVEGRVAIPAERFPAVQFPGFTARLPKILEEERAWAVSANRERREAADSSRDERAARDALQWIAPLVALVAALGFLLVWWRWGREPARPADVGKYVRDLPDDPPAVVDALMHWGRIRPNAFGATVLDLAQRGFLSIRQYRVDRGILPDRTEYEFTLAEPVRGVGDDGIVAGTRPDPDDDDDDDDDATEEEDLEEEAADEDGDDADDDAAETRSDPSPDGLLVFERATLEQVFASGPTVTQSVLVKSAREDGAGSIKRWQRFETSVQRSLRARGYLRVGHRLPAVINVVAVVIVTAVAVTALVVHAWIGGAIALAWASIQLSLTPLLRQRSAKGSRRYHEWTGVRSFLHDFSRLADAPAGHLVLWERYLVYAVALGVSDELARGLATKIPPDQAAAFAGWYAGSDGHGYGSIGHFSQEFAGDAVGSFGPPSSTDAGGGGGGFSGGGGGGGGGGGIGAG